MTNPYFDFVVYASRFSPGALARAEDINAVFDLVTGGFDDVQTDLALKAPLASPTFTGTATFTGTIDADAATAVLVPSPGATTDDSLKAATTAWVHDLVGSLSVGLPLQTGFSGKFLTTDGTSASWASPFPSQTGNSGKFLRTNGTTPSWVFTQQFLAGGYQAISTDTTLTASSATYCDMSASPSGTVLTLPDATTLELGYTATVDGAAASGTTGTAANDGTLLKDDGSVCIFMLTNNSTAAGTWMQWVMNGSSAGFAAIDMTAAASVKGSDTTLRSSKDRTDFCEISAGVYLCATGAVAGSGVDVFVVSASGTSLSTGAVSTVGTDTVAWIRVLAVTGGYVVLYATTLSGAVKAIAVTVSGTTATAGSATTVLAAIDCAGEGDMQALRAESNGTDVCLVAKTSTTLVRAIMVDITGTTVNLGAEATVFTAGATLTALRVGLCVLSAGAFGLALSVTDTTDTIRVRRLTYSGLTITAGTETNAAVTMGPCSVLPLSSTSMLMFNYITGASTARVVSAMDTTPVLNATTSLTAATGTGRSFESVACGSTYVAVAETGSAARLLAVTVSGTTVSAAGSAVSMTSSASVSGVQPYWDGTYLHYAYGGALRGDLYTVTGAGLTVSALSSSAASHSAVGPGTRLNFRLTSPERIVVFGSDCKGQIVRFRAATA